MSAVTFNSLLLGGVAAVGAAGSACIAISGSKFFNKASQIFAEKEKAYPLNPVKATACRIAKWAALALSAITGTVGAVVAGLYVSTVVQAFSIGTLTPVAIGAGIATAALLEAYVLKKLVSQILFNRTIPAPAPAAAQ